MDEPVFLFDGWLPVARVVFIAAAGYLSLLVLLRVSGQRTLAQMTAFDFVIAVTIGSAFGRTLTAREVSIVEIIAMFLILIALQWLVAWTHERLGRRSRLLSGIPTLVYNDGQFIRQGMRRHRLTEQDLYSVAREKGLGSLAEAHAIVFEPDGKFAVISPSQRGDGSALEHLEER
jgi:uncharacterized membrane protein YcaP (DUF421 family)